MLLAVASVAGAAPTGAGASSAAEGAAELASLPPDAPLLVFGAAAASAAATPRPPAWVRTDVERSAARAALTEKRPPPPPIGEGFHVFDPTYLALGVNSQSLCQATAWEIEASVSIVSDSMLWVGAYGTAGVQVGRRPDGYQRPSEADSCFDPGFIYYKADSKRDPFGDPGNGFRFGAGVEGGWRMLGIDLGYLRNTALQNPDHGFRLRAGLALAQEIFTGGATRYGKECCSNADSVVPCECHRNPMGVALFFYYAREEYFDLDSSTRWGQNSVGISLKLAMGVGGAP